MSNSALRLRSRLDTIGRKQAYETDKHLQSLSDEQLAEPFPYKDMSGNPWSEPLHQQLTHVLFHSMYHRGQVVTLLRQLGAKAPQTDLIHYLRQTR